MPYRINIEAASKNAGDRVVQLVQLEIDRYFKYATKSEEIDFVFLKSMIYVEEVIKSVTEKLFGTNSRDSLEKHIKQLELIKDDTCINSSITLLRQAKGFRNKMAHSLEYTPSEDHDFSKYFSFLKTDNLSEKKYKVAMKFKDIAHGFIYLKIGIDEISNFIVFLKT